MKKNKNKQTRQKKKMNMAMSAGDDEADRGSMRRCVSIYVGGEWEAIGQSRSERES